MESSNRIEIESRNYVSHLVMEGNFFVERAFIGRVNPAQDFDPRGSAADVDRFWEAESFNDVVEVRRSSNRESSE